MTPDITPESVAQMIADLDASNMMHPISNETAWSAAKMLFAMETRIIKLQDLFDERDGFIADFAAADFEAIGSPGYVHPEDEQDDVTDLGFILAWQEDARALIAPQPGMQEAAE